MNFKKSISIIVLSVLFISANLYSQAVSKAHLAGKPTRISVMYKELLTNENGVNDKSTVQLTKLHKTINDSIMIWASKFDLTKAKGFSDFATFLGNKLNIPLSKKIDLTFYDSSDNREDYILWSLNPHKFEFEKTQVNKR